jgi:predicted SPOUT superfamily RNA methylase MTH1
MAFIPDMSVAIPASLVSDVPHLREKTSKIGMVGRSLAIFGIKEVIILADDPELDQHVEVQLIMSVLSYLETPQYLRKQLFRIMPELKYVGVLPPLRTPHHPLSNQAKELRNLEYREGVTLRSTRKGTLVDIGIERPVLITDKRLPFNRRITVKVKKSDDKLKATVADRNEISEYWGYKVSSPKLSFGQFLKKRRFDLVVATSKYGKAFLAMSEEMERRFGTAKNVLVAFGAPAKGLHEIVNQEDLNLENVADFIVNTVPGQKAHTVRTEEAVLITLGILNSTFAKG